MESNKQNIDVKKYLVTEKSDYKQFPKEKISQDFQDLQKAEIRSKARRSVSTWDQRDGEVKRAKKALSLNNPFKGF